MRIAELFVSLGFDVKGLQGFKDVESGMKTAAVDAGKLTLGVGAVNVAMLALINLSMRAGVALKNFGLQTALDGEELQKWQHIAAVNDVSAEQLTQTILSLQDARSQFALGEPQAVAAWSLLGVNPTQDPFKVLEDLRKQLLTFQDRGVARNLAAKVGIDSNVFQMLVASNAEFEKWNRNLAITRQQQERLRTLDASWKDLRFTLGQVAAQFGAALAPALRMATGLLKFLIDKLAIVNQWLNSNTTIATIMRTVLGWLVVGFLLLGAALAVVTAAAGALALALAVLTSMAIPLLVAFSPLLVVLGLMAAAIAFLALAFEDFWAALHGGKSLFDWHREIAMAHALGRALEYIKDGITSIPSEFLRNISGIAHVWRNNTPAWLGGTGHAFDHFGEMTDMAGHPARAAGAAQISQENNVQIHVDGSRAPAETAAVIGKTLKNEYANAAYQMPVPNY